MSKAIKAFECGICHAVHVSEKLADDCETKCKTHQTKVRRQELLNSNWDKHMNEMRLKAESLVDILKGIEEAAEKYFGVKMKFTHTPFRFTSIACTHDAPIGKPTVWGSRDNKNNDPTHYLGWSAWVEGQWLKDGKGKQSHRDTISFPPDLGGRNGGIKGFNTGTFNGGSKFSGEVRLYLDDFPKLKKQYEKMKELEAKEALKSEQVNIRIQKANLRQKELEAKDESVLKYEGVLNKLVEEKKALEVKILEANKNLQGRVEELKQTAEEQIKKEFKIPCKYNYDTGALALYRKTFTQSRY